MKNWLQPRGTGSRKVLGFTLVEMTAAISLSMMAAGTGLAILNQHIVFLRTMQSFEFLRTEAPQINSLVGQAVSRATSYRVHATAVDAFAGIRAVNADGRALRLIFRNPGGSVEQSVLAFESVSGAMQLNFYHHDGVSWSSRPDWSVTRAARDVTFSDTSGILLMTIQGPSAEEIIYAATTE